MPFPYVFPIPLGYEPVSAAAIRDRVRVLIESITPTSLSADRFRSYRNEGSAGFQAWAEANPTAAFRRFQARYNGAEDPPESSNTDVDLRHFSILIQIAYPQTARFGPDQALDRDDVMDQDWGLVNGKIGIYGGGNFANQDDCTPLGAEKLDDVRGTGVDIMQIVARFSYYRDVT